VTIAAGFHFNGGVLLCADSQLSYGAALKERGQKLFSFNLDPLPAKIGFGIAGSVPHAKEAIRKITTDLSDIADPSVVTLRKVVETIEETLSKYYKAKIYTHPKYGMAEGSPDFWLLMTIWTERDGVSLFCNQEDALTGVNDFEAFGSGWYLFRYITAANYANRMEIEPLLILATHALKQVKNTDPNCGFNSEFLAFFEHNKKFSAVAEYDVAHVEDYSPQVQDAVYELFFLMANPSVIDHAIDDAKLRFLDKMTKLREAYLADKKTRMRFAELMKALYELPEKEA
jgi:20S proteasome alpha/beta subunit